MSDFLALNLPPMETNKSSRISDYLAAYWNGVTSEEIKWSFHKLADKVVYHVADLQIEQNRKIKIPRETSVFFVPSIFWKILIKMELKTWKYTVDISIKYLVYMYLL